MDLHHHGIKGQKWGDYMVPIEKPPIDEFMHYGIKGMKWGVRKDDVTKARKNILKGGKKLSRKVRNAYYINPAKRSRANASARRRTMSDKELDARIARLKKEQQLKELTEADISPGRKALKTFGKATFGAAGTAAGAAAVKYVLGSRAEGTAFKDIKLVDVGKHVGKQLKKIKK